MNNIFKFIKVTTRFQGVHCFPEAKDQYRFLRSLHRHMFEVTVVVSVSHNNREIEFLELKDSLNDYIENVLTKEPIWEDSISCEDMAEYICDFVRVVTEASHIEARVDEDGENGAIVVKEYE